MFDAKAQRWSVPSSSCLTVEEHAKLLEILNTKHDVQAVNTACTAVLGLLADFPLPFEFGRYKPHPVTIGIFSHLSTTYSADGVLPVPCLTAIQHVIQHHKFASRDDIKLCVDRAPVLSLFLTHALQSGTLRAGSLFFLSTLHEFVKCLNETSTDTSSRDVIPTGQLSVLCICVSVYVYVVGLSVYVCVCLCMSTCAYVY